jgi:hypothetical protein
MDPNHKDTQITHVDFSQQAIEKAVVKHTLTKPLPLYSIFGGTGGLLFSWITAPVLPGLAGLIAGAAGISVLVGAGACGWNYLFRRQSIAGEYIQYLHEQMAAKRLHDLEMLKHQLYKFLEIPGEDQYAEQAIQQFEHIKIRSEEFSELLQNKLNIGELTFSRYLGAVEQVALSIIDNIRQILNTLKSVSHIDERYIDDRLQKLNALPEKKHADIEEEKTLFQRQKLRRDQLDKVNELLTYNEQAMTEFDKLTVAVSDMKTDSPLAKSDLETSISDLQQLAQRAKIYR